MYTISQAIKSCKIHFPIIDTISPGLSADLLRIEKILQNNDYLFPKKETEFLYGVREKIHNVWFALERDSSHRLDPEIVIACIIILSAYNKIDGETRFAMQSEQALHTPIVGLTKEDLTPKNCAKFSSGIALVREVYAQYRNFYSQAERHDIEKCFSLFFDAAEAMLTQFDQLKIQFNMDLQVTVSSSSAKVPPELSGPYYSMLEEGKKVLLAMNTEQENKIQEQLQKDFIRKNLEFLNSIQTYLSLFYAAIASKKLFFFFNAHFSPSGQPRKDLAATFAKLKQIDTESLPDLATRIINGQSMMLNEAQEDQLLGLLFQIRALIPKAYAGNNYLIFLVLKNKLLSFVEPNDGLSEISKHQLWAKLGSIDDNYQLFEQPWGEYKADLEITTEIVTECYDAIFNNAKENHIIQKILFDFSRHNTLDKRFTQFLFGINPDNFLWQSYKRNDIPTFCETLRVFPESVDTLTQEQVGRIVETANSEWQHVIFNRLILHPFALWQIILSGASDQEILMATKEFATKIRYSDRDDQKNLFILKSVKQLAQYQNRQKPQHVMLDIEQNLSKEYLALLRTAINFHAEMYYCGNRMSSLLVRWTGIICLLSILALSAVSFFAIIQYSDITIAGKVFSCIAATVPAVMITTCCLIFIQLFVTTGIINPQYYHAKKDFMVALDALESSLKASDSKYTLLSIIMHLFRQYVDNIRAEPVLAFMGISNDEIKKSWDTGRCDMLCFCALLITLATHPEIKKSLDTQAANTAKLVGTEGYLWKSWRNQEKVAGSDVQPEETTRLLGRRSATLA